MGRPTTSNGNVVNQEQSSAQTSDTAYSHSQASTVNVSFTNSEVSAFQALANLTRQKRRGRGDASIRDSRSPQMCNSTYETQSSVHNVNTTDPSTEQKAKKKSSSKPKKDPLTGSLLGVQLQPFTATPPQAPHPLPSATPSRSDYQHHSGSHGLADAKLSKSSYHGTCLYEPIGPPPTQSSPRKQSSRRSPESKSEAVDCNIYYRSDGLPKSPELSSNTEPELIDCGGFYKSPGAFPRSEGQRKLSRAVYAASDNTRADRNKLEGIENGSRIHTGRLVKQLAPQDELQSKILGDIYGPHYGREHHLARL